MAACVAIAMALFTLVLSPESVVVRAIKCSPCPFEWRHHGPRCHRYREENLPANKAQESCGNHVSGNWASQLASVDSLATMVQLMQYVDEVFNNDKLANQTKYIRLHRIEREYGNYSMIYSNSLDSRLEKGGNSEDCREQTPSVAVSMSDTGTGVYGMVPAPEVVEQRCAVYAGEGAYLDLGDFAGTCVSDPDLCASEAMTWSVWIKMASSARDGYILSTGGRTRQGRGIYVRKNRGQLSAGARSLRKSRSWVEYLDLSLIPFDTWFHFALVVELRTTPPQLTVYVDGAAFNFNSSGSGDLSYHDTCTRVYMGSSNPCGSTSYSSLVDGTSAAYSNLMVFDNALTSAQIQALYACGSLDWDLKIRSLYFDGTHMDSDSLRYVCEASASTGPTIDWRVYHADQAQWEDLGPSSEPGVDITPTSLSTCVVQSVLVIDRSRGPSSEGDIIACTATDGSGTASVYIRQGSNAHIGYSDHQYGGLFVSRTGTNYNRDGFLASIADDSLPYPFICEMEKIRV